MVFSSEDLSQKQPAVILNPVYHHHHQYVFNKVVDTLNKLLYVIK